MKFHIAALFAPLAMAASAASAQAECKPEFVLASQTIAIADIAVSSGASSSETFQIRVRNDGQSGSKCSAVLRVSRLSTSLSSNEIAYNLRSRGKNLEILSSENLPGTAASDLTLPQLPQGSNGLSIPFQLTIPSGWGLSSGSQIDDLIISLVDASGSVVDTQLLTVSLNVPPAVEVRVVGVTGQNAIASINLGILDPQATNVSDPFGVRIWSTGPYSVTFRSQNDGKLVHSSVNASIDYQLLMDRQPVSVVGAVAAFMPSGTDSLGNLHPMGVRVEPFLARAGNYSDRVEVTVTAN